MGLILEGYDRIDIYSMTTNDITSSADASTFGAGDWITITAVYPV
jgi:hypothetical protein